LRSFPFLPDAVCRRLLVASGVVVIAIGVAVLVCALLFNGGSTGDDAARGASGTDAASPSSPRSTSPTPMASASARADPATEPAPTTAPAAPRGATAITSFSVSPTTVECNDERTAPVPLSFSWVTTGAERVWIGVGTTDAAAQPFAEVATDASGYSDITFDCSALQKVFTLTVEAGGVRTSRTVVVERELQ
jgi:hypothetical protein